MSTIACILSKSSCFLFFSSEVVVDLQTPDDVTHSDAEDSTNDSTNDDVANPEAELAPASIKPNDYEAVKLSGRRHKDYWYMAMVNIIPILCN